LFEPGVQAYAERLHHYAKFELVELAASRASHAEQARDEEGERMRALRQPRELCVAMDERGKAFDSRELSAFLAKAQQGAKDLLFLIGGDEGLCPALVTEADAVVSLSKMTLPHRLARLVLVEQLYRAFTLLRGEPYHK